MGVLTNYVTEKIKDLRYVSVDDDGVPKKKLFLKPTDEDEYFEVDFVSALDVDAISSALSGTFAETAKAAGVLANGSNMATELQAWATAQAARAGLGILLPGTYRQDDQVSLDSGTTFSAYGALLQAPAGSNFNMLAVEGLVGTHKFDVVILGLAVDMQGTAQTVDANGIYLLYADDVRIIDFEASNCEFEGVLARWTVNTWIVRFRGTGILGDSLHFEEATDWGVDSPVIVGAGAEAGIGTTGEETARGRIINPDISGHGIGIGISGGHDITVDGGHLHDLLATSGATIGVKVETASGDDSYDITFDGLKVSDIDQTNGYGVAITEPNRNHADHPITFRNGEIDAGIRPAVSIVSAGEVIFEDQIIRTTGSGITLTGTGPKPGGITRLRRVHFIGCSQPVVGSAGANSGTLYYEDCTLDGVPLENSDFSDPTWPIKVGDSGWIVLTLNAGWANAGGIYPVLRYRKVNGWVQVEGFMSNTSGSPSTAAVATLPDDYRPEGTQVRQGYGQVQITVDGVIAPSAAAGAVGTGDALSVYVSFPAAA